ncbi:MAG: AAA family ATPase [Pirellulales bacterium]|nr:AAA family ATPase [Pirellulales bacterium]
MYEKYWQLRQKPFEPGVDPKFYYPGESHQAALLKLRYALENRRGGALLTGPAGIGKTLLTALLRDALGEAFTPFVHLVFPQLTPPELLAYAADALEGSPGAVAPEAAPRNLQRIEAFLAGNSRKGRHAVLVVDEAQLIDSAATFETLRLLMNFTTDGTPAWTLLLAGQPALLPVLGRMPHWEERFAVKCLLRPLTLEETASYVNHRLQVAGAKRTIVDADAFPTLHELTHGLPRRINRLCDLALLIGYAEEQKTLGAAHFESVCRELVTVEPE